MNVNETATLNELERSYQAYLESDLHPQVGQILIPVLQSNGLEVEAQGLSVYLEQGEGATYFPKVDLWSSSLCTVGKKIPSDAQNGDLWFDPIELNLAILVEHLPYQSHHVTSWISIHPVYVWQYRTFLRLVEVGKEVNPFALKDGYLSLNRIEEQDSLGFISNIYQDEAIAYTGWIGKSPCSQHQLEAANEQLSSSQMQSVLPLPLRVWEGSDFQEQYRIAVALNTIYRNPSLDYDDIIERSKRLESCASRMLYDEWECQDNVGILTSSMMFFAELYRNTKERAFKTSCYEILNYAPF
jgi:hypothetical protein